MARAADRGRAAVDAAVGSERPLFLGGRAGVEVRHRQLTRLREVPDPVESRAVKEAKLGVAPGELDESLPEGLAVEEVLSSLAARATEELAVPPDLGLEAAVRHVDPAARLGEARQVREEGKVFPVDHHAQVDGDAGRDQRVDSSHDAVERCAAAGLRAPAVVDRRWTVEGDLDLLHWPAGEVRQEGLEVEAVRDHGDLERPGPGALEEAADALPGRGGVAQRLAAEESDVGPRILVRVVAIQVREEGVTISGAMRPPAEGSSTSG